ncbi:MAG: phosphate acyltransferase, partial [Methylococcaceae bacterium]
MGGDHGPKVTIPASLDCLKNNPELKLILVGNETVIQQMLPKDLTAYQDRLTIHHASQYVDMDESPSKALKNKKDSSMRVAINLVRDGHANACV